MKKVIAILLMLGCTSISISSQDEISEEVLTEISRDIDYSKQRWTLAPRHEREKIDPIEYEPNESSTIGNIAGYILAVLLLMGVIMGVLYFLFSSSTERSPDIESRQIGEEEIDPNHIDNIDPMSLIDEALSNGDYRLALRLRFVDFIKRSSDLKLIKWRSDKTNQEYLHELKAHIDFDYLRSVILEYEKVWFGNYDISGQEYALYAEQYDILISQLNAAHE